MPKPHGFTAESLKCPDGTVQSAVHAGLTVRSARDGQVGVCGAIQKTDGPELRNRRRVIRLLEDQSVFSIGMMWQADNQHCNRPAHELNSYGGARAPENAPVIAQTLASRCHSSHVRQNFSVSGWARPQVLHTSGR